MRPNYLHDLAAHLQTVAERLQAFVDALMPMVGDWTPPR